MAKGTKLEDDHGAPKAAAAGEEVVIRAPVHCDGCGRKLRRSLQRLLDGDGEVIVDSATNTVVVRGPKAAGNAAEAVRIVEKRTGRKAVLVSPAPEKSEGPKPKKKDGGNKDVTDDLPEINMNMVVVLRMNLHCDACCEEIKRRILRIKGVEDAVPHLKSSQMMVKGMVEPATLVGFIHNCTGRKAAIFRAGPLDPPPQPPKSPPPPLESEPKKPEHTGDKKDGQDNGNKEEEPQEEGNKAGGGEDTKEPKREKPDGGGGDAGEEEEPHGDDDDEAAKDDDGVVLESHKKEDQLFTAVPVPAGVVAVAPPPVVDGAAGYYYSYPSSYYHPYAHPAWGQYQCQPQPQPLYPAYSYAGGPGMYGYASYQTEPFSEENPNTCAIV